MQESLPPEHGSELFGDAFEELLDGGGVAHERRRHLQTDSMMRRSMFKKYKNILRAANPRAADRPAGGRPPAGRIIDPLMTL
jgi:hypothetical protein